MLPFKRCCCCSLRAGSFVIGYFYVISSLILSVLSITLYTQIEQQQEEIESDNYMSYISSILISGMTILFNILLVTGVHLKNKSLVLSWLITKSVIFSIVSAFACIGIVAMLYVVCVYASLHLLVLIFIIITSLVVEWLLIAVIFSYYKELQQEIQHSIFKNEA